MKPLALIPSLLLVVAGWVLSSPVLAQNKATADEATAMVKRGVVALKAAGKDRDKLYAEVTAQSPRWANQELYLVVYGLDGVVRAHGANARLVGAAMLEMLDVDGRPYIKERIQQAKAKGSFWQSYKYINPATKKIEPKRMYCERLDDSVVCAGIYK
jgi:cytochrome c